MKTTYWIETRAYVSGMFGSTYAHKLGCMVSVRRPSRKVQHAPA